MVRPSRAGYEPWASPRQAHRPGAVGAILRHAGLLRALTYVPTRFQTPMEVQIKKS
jgi:hypothetical protein